MRKNFFCLGLLLCTISFISCETEEKELVSNNNSTLDLPAKPGTYLYKNMENRWFWLSGCTGTSGLCVIEVKKLETAPDRINLTPYKGDHLQLEDLKNVYIAENLIEVQKNLDVNELITFKEIMKFNSDKNLVSYDLDLLEKAYQSKDLFYNKVSEITLKLDQKTENIIIVEESGKEIIIKK
ncbi:hypothetical protein [Myroides odoratus]|uniref:Lipoprotein n=1 Tax=Myroides odoratus TaxID=256 RepID=A0A9Q6Z702_MYROD|nr:hypothetical protein [Myroides odoratus]EHQ42729.1 hypothetical protein Myrod_1897 [Myroides odoratus DSM 2801]EKB07544.1 hypothetical protein HMPREF9716_01755 [Myroides odoratus CIP 103059]QQU00087.1 hypothetical protein I6I88_18310 [Myroides odoratus]WQD57693.1 hypothetical protein U0010_00640 [Myroides odoratus]STZ29993.1 Uncharacterised protein [Myroides odoratus]